MTNEDAISKAKEVVLEMNPAEKAGVIREIFPNFESFYIDAHQMFFHFVLALAVQIRDELPLNADQRTREALTRRALLSVYHDQDLADVFLTKANKAPGNVCNIEGRLLLETARRIKKSQPAAASLTAVRIREDRHK